MNVEREFNKHNLEAIKANVDWTPVARSFSTFLSYSLRPWGNDGSMCFYSRPIIKILAVLLLTGAVTIAWLNLVFLAKIGIGTGVIVFLIAIILLVMGIATLIRSCRYVVFSKKHQAFFITHKNPKLLHISQINKLIPFQDIIAFQIIEKVEEMRYGNRTANNVLVTTKDAQIVYELNLVRSGYGRINITCHGNYQHLNTEVNMLLDLVRVPVLEKNIDYGK